VPLDILEPIIDQFSSKENLKFFEEFLQFSECVVLVDPKQEMLWDVICFPIRPARIGIASRG
jgi:hypothetical protein